MHRLSCLFCGLALSLSASADSDVPAFAFAVRPAVPISISPFQEDGTLPLTPVAGDEPDALASSRERRRAARERLLSAMGLDRFVPALNFTTFGREARVSLGLQEDGNVSFRLRVKW